MRQGGGAIASSNHQKGQGGGAIASSNHQKGSCPLGVARTGNSDLRTAVRGLWVYCTVAQEAKIARGLAVFGPGRSALVTGPGSERSSQLRLAEELIAHLSEQAAKQDVRSVLIGCMRNEVACARHDCLGEGRLEVLGQQRTFLELQSG